MGHTPCKSDSVTKYNKSIKEKRNQHEKENTITKNVYELIYAEGKQELGLVEEYYLHDASQGLR